MFLFYRELEILIHVRHPHVLGMIGYCLLNSRCPQTIFTEWMPKGELASLLFSPDLSKALTDTDKMRIIVGIVLGMKYMHASGVVHRELSANNVLLYGHFSAKVANFADAVPDGYQ
jgi:serine/threonine protein kinase